MNKRGRIPWFYKKRILGLGFVISSWHFSSLKNGFVVTNIGFRFVSTSELRLSEISSEQFSVCSFRVATSVPLQTHLFAPTDEENPPEEYNDATKTHSLQNEWVEGKDNEPSAV